MDFEFNMIPGHGLITLSEGMKKLKSLSTLFLFDINITGFGYPVLCRKQSLYYITIDSVVLRVY